MDMYVNSLFHRMYKLSTMESCFRYEMQTNTHAAAVVVLSVAANENRSLTYKNTGKG
jgi:hypothetical protein